MSREVTDEIVNLVVIGFLLSHFCETLRKVNSMSLYSIKVKLGQK